MKVAIIGAGAAGLCAGRHCLRENFSFDIFEQTGNVGGTWNYTDFLDYDENDIPVHSSMYKGLRTNLPKELMSYEDFPYPEQKRSFLFQREVLDYIRSYSKKFQIDPHVKFYKRVLRVQPQNLSWRVEIEDVRTKEKEILKYDAVMVCNGHYKDPFIPAIPGDKNFEGNIKHSHVYRSPDYYKDKKVLVIGAGPSGTDISNQIVKVAKKVYLSHKSKLPLTQISNQIKQKSVVSKLERSVAYFDDGSREEIDDILLCTGYLYTFPFLNDNCGVKIDDNYVHPLYKQIISIENPTLAFIGLPLTVCPFPLFDVQVRFFLSTLNGHFKLPSTEEMVRDLEENIAAKRDKPQRKYHQLGEEQGSYFEELTETAKIKRVPVVIQKLYLRVRMNRNVNDCFRIIDDENFEEI